MQLEKRLFYEEVNSSRFNLDQRQKQIYENLCVLGEGPAAFFKDACLLMACPDEFRSTSHVVAFLLRDVESSLRYVFRPLKNDDSQKKGNNSQKKEKKPPSQENQELKKLHDQLQDLVHRRGLGPPIPADKIEILWEEIKLKVKPWLSQRSDSELASALFYEDACKLMSDPHRFSSTTHLVAHLLRETIGPAVRGQQVTGGGQKPNGRGTHREQIHSILSYLKIPKESEAAQVWLKLADNLSWRTHRRSCDPPRPVDDDFQAFWTDSLKWLEVLSGELRRKFLQWVSVLDELLKEPEPTKRAVQRLTQEVPNCHVFRKYFFGKLKNPKWLSLLEEKRFFQSPPGPYYDEENGFVSFPPWPQADYLARMASNEPQLVAEIIKKMDHTDNPVVLKELAGALLNMQPSISFGLVNEVKKWARCPYLVSIHGVELLSNIGKLLARWAEENSLRNREEISEIADHLLKTLWNEIQRGLGTRRGSTHPPDLWVSWIYREFLKNRYLRIVPAVGLPALETLCGMLEEVVGHSSRGGSEARIEYNSFYWRPAIEDHPQNYSDTPTLEDSLVSAVRDAAEALAKDGLVPVEEIVKLLEGRKFKIFWRIALHVLRVSPEGADELAAERLTDQTLFKDDGFLHEYVLLLRKYFPGLAQERKQKILGWIDQGVKVGNLSEEEIWQRNWLARIGPEQLNEEWKKRYQDLVERRGEPEESELEFPCLHPSWLRLESPMSI